MCTSYQTSVPPKRIDFLNLFIRQVSRLKRPHRTFRWAQTVLACVMYFFIYLFNVNAWTPFKILFLSLLFLFEGVWKRLANRCFPILLLVGSLFLYSICTTTMYTHQIPTPTAQLRAGIIVHNVSLEFDRQNYEIPPAEINVTTPNPSLETQYKGVALGLGMRDLHGTHHADIQYSCACDGSFARTTTSGFDKTAPRVPLTEQDEQDIVKVIIITTHQCHHHIIIIIPITTIRLANG